MRPGTWLKHYVCPDKPNPHPMYFYFVGILRTDGKETPIIQCEWGTRLPVNDWFMHWLKPCSEGEVGKIKQNKKIVQPTCEVIIPPKKAETEQKSMAAAVSAPATLADFKTTWPRLFGIRDSRIENERRCG